MSKNVYWLLKVDVNPGQTENAQSLMHEMVAATHDTEPGALNYEWSYNGDKSSIHIYERYADSEATMIHLGNFGSKFGERFMKCFAPTSFIVYGEASPDVKEALAGFGPEFYTPAAGFKR